MMNSRVNSEVGELMTMVNNWQGNYGNGKKMDKLDSVVEREWRNLE